MGNNLGFFPICPKRDDFFHSYEIVFERVKPYRQQFANATCRRKGARAALKDYHKVEVESSSAKGKGEDEEGGMKNARGEQPWVADPEKRPASVIPELMQQEKKKKSLWGRMKASMSKTFGFVEVGTTTSGSGRNGKLLSNQDFLWPSARKHKIYRHAGRTIQAHLRHLHDDPPVVRAGGVLGAPPKVLNDKYARPSSFLFGPPTSGEESCEEAGGFTSDANEHTDRVARIVFTEAHSTANPYDHTML